MNFIVKNVSQLGEEQLQQYIDAAAVFDAWESSAKEMEQYRGGMFWKEQSGHRYLVRTSTRGSQKSLGVESASTISIYDKFTQGKSEAQERHRSLCETMETMRRLNKAHRVGRAPDTPIQVLSAIARHKIDSSFLVVGTYALYAYEAALGVRVSPKALATRDVDLLFDVQTRIKFLAQLSRNDKSFIGLLQDVDKSFRVKAGQKYTAVNNKAFEVDVVRRMNQPGDIHPLRMTDDEDDLWAVQVSTGGALATSPRFSQMVVSANGYMARMHTVWPDTFSRVKLALSQNPNRDPKKAPKDAAQAAVVSEMIEAGMFDFLLKKEAAETPEEAMRSASSGSTQTNKPSFPLQTRA